MLTLEEKRQQDERSVDELLSFIEDGGGRAGATPRGSKKKKGKQSRKVLPLQVKARASADLLWVSTAANSVEQTWDQ